MRLAETVNAAFALFEPIRVPRKVVMQNRVKMVLLGGVYLVIQLDAYRDFERVFTGNDAALEGGAEQGRRVARALSDPVLRPYGEVSPSAE